MLLVLVVRIVLVVCIVLIVLIVDIYGHLWAFVGICGRLVLTHLFTIFSGCSMLPATAHRRPFSILQQGMHDGDYASIQIDNVEHCSNGRGMNAVRSPSRLARVLAQSKT